MDRYNSARCRARVLREKDIHETERLEMEGQLSDQQNQQPKQETNKKRHKKQVQHSVHNKHW